MEPRSATRLDSVLQHREPDEGAVAHIWQILMAGQLPLLTNSAPPQRRRFSRARRRGLAGRGFARRSRS
jgi:hypothetical protein